MWLGAWIVTGGTNAGIMKLCGEAVHDYILAHGERDNSVVTIGVATWGIITNRKQLISGSGSKVSANRQYFFYIRWFGGSVDCALDSQWKGFEFES